MADEKYISLHFKNTDTGSTITSAVNIFTKINKLRDQISSNVYTSFELDINEYDIVEAGFQDSERHPSIDENSELNIYETYGNKITGMVFYIRPCNGIFINDNNIRVIDHGECPVCYRLLNEQRVTQLSCSHMFCGSCYEQWDIHCSNNSISTTCPLCRSG